MRWLLYFVTDGKLNIFLWIRRGLARRVLKIIMIMKEWRDDACRTCLGSRGGSVCSIPGRQAVETNLAPTVTKVCRPNLRYCYPTTFTCFRREFKDSIKINNSYLSIAFVSIELTKQL